MVKRKNILGVLGCVLCMTTAHANTGASEDKARQYARQVIFESLAEADRELTAEERQIEDEIVKAYLILQKEHEQSLTQLQMAQTPPTTDSQNNELLAKKLLELKQSMHEFFLDRNFGMEHRSALVYPDDSPDKTAVDDETLEGQTNQTNHEDDKADEK
ncbi:Uncharacterised protein [Moraxella equi]|uniref:Uncharacterized protein n=2 Tax=Moraxella equi TaxID=60442 RepID=A0A378QSB9_9GAMM|nr:Uncharacterised protein [Moraxella equi]